MAYRETEREPQWFVMRDLKRANAKLPAFKQLEAAHLTVFTPKEWRLMEVRGKKERVEVPVMHDLLFVRDTRENLDPVVEGIPSLQYRWLRGKYMTPMTVPYADMERFIRAVCLEDATLPLCKKYYRPEEVTPELCGHRIRVVGGPLDGYEGCLLTTRGSTAKRLLVELPGILSAGVEVSPEYIQVIK